MLKGLFYLMIFTAFSMLDIRAVEVRNIEPLTANVDIWQSNQNQFARKFPELLWKFVEEEEKFEYRSKGMVFWGEPVSKLNLVETEGAITSLKLTLLDQGTAIFMKQSEFDSLAKRWNKIITKRLKSEGTRIESLFVGKVKHIRIAWSCEGSVVVLSANIGPRPDRIELICYERDFGLAQLKLKGQQLENRDDGGDVKEKINSTGSGTDNE